MGSIWEEPLQIQQQHSTFPAIAPVMPPKLLFDPLELPMKALSPLACPVVIDHRRRIQRDQDFITKGFVDLSIRNVRGIYRADFTPFPKGEMGTGFGFPTLFQHRSPPCCRTRKKVAFKVLNTLFPPHPVTALFPVEEHLPIGKNFIHRPKAITPGLFPFLPLCSAALEPRFMPFLACHNKSIRPSYKCVVGCHLNCFVLTHEMG